MLRIVFLYPPLVPSPPQRGRAYMYMYWRGGDVGGQYFLGGGLPYESDGDASRKIRIKPLKETNLGVVQALFDP